MEVNGGIVRIFLAWVKMEKISVSSTISSSSHVYCNVFYQFLEPVCSCVKNHWLFTHITLIY